MSRGAGRHNVAPLDALMFRADADPATRAVMTGALVLAEAPDWDRLTAVLEAATVEVPRLRQKVVTPLLPVGAAEWMTDPAFDMGYHLRRRLLDGDGLLADVLEACSAEATEPFDMARPLWEATLVEGLADGMAVLVLRVHHALTDGVGAVEMLGAMLELSPDAPAAVTRGEAPRPATSRGRLTVRRLTRAPLRLPGQSMAASRTALQLTWFPGWSLHRAASLVSSFRRVLDASGAETSLLLRSRSQIRRYGAIDVPLGALKSAAKDVGGTVNDAYLAALLGGFQRYHERMGAVSGDVPTALPINLRADGPDGVGGNHFSAAVIAGPATIADPAARIARVGALVRAARSEDGLQAAMRLVPLLALLPDRLASRGLAAHGRRIDLQASNVIGSPVPTYLAGARVVRLYPFGPLPGVPVMVVLLSHDGVCCVGVTLDPAAVVEPELFLRCLVAGFDEVLDGRGEASLVAGG